MKILSISGSSRKESSNSKLLDHLSILFPSHEFMRSESINELPLFKPENLDKPLPNKVVEFQTEVEQADAIIICTPEYIHNIPALLKNGLEWITESGSIMHKPTIALGYTPYPPRGEKAMKSLLFSLVALDVKVVAQLETYKTKLSFEDGELKGDDLEIFKACISLLFE